ncbi:hypothetical protein ACTXT7_003728 [Hymenolepis weldensis]
MCARHYDDSIAALCYAHACTRVLSPQSPLIAALLTLLPASLSLVPTSDHNAAHLVALAVWTQHGLDLLEGLYLVFYF